MKDLSAIIILTNQCNLKCAYCVYGCDLNLKPYYITIEELRETLKLMKQKIPSLTRIILSGGDAFMHPLILQICKEVRKFFPDIVLCVYTNGLLLNKISDSDILYMNNILKLSILTSIYPNIKNLKEYKEQDERFSKLGIKLEYQFSHFYFSKINLKTNNTELPIEEINKHYYTNCKTITIHNNLITIYKNKILVCCGEVGYVNSNKFDTSDLLDLKLIKTEQDIIDFCKIPHNICRSCVKNSKESSCKILWNKTSDLTQKYQETNLEFIFINNYNDYKKIYLENNDHLFCFQDEFFYDKIDPLELEYLNIKYKNGLGDIFIPYNNNLNIKQLHILKDKLLSIPNIKNYNLYFVGINTNIELNKIMFENFYFPHTTNDLKTTFLLEKNITLGYKEFFKYSYLHNKILLDIDTFLNKGVFLIE